MKINSLFISLLVLLSLEIAGQNNFKCGTDELTNAWLNSQPQMKQSFLIQQREEKTRDSLNYVQGYDSKPIPAITIYTIPIVFHVLHQYGAENISDAQIMDEVNILNRAYRKLNPDTINIVPPFKPADARIEFRLATKDTMGYCTTGIVRHADVRTNWTINSSNYIYTWNPEKYLNVYLVKSIPGFAYGGYTPYPGSYPASMDVVVVTSDCIGSIGTSATYKSWILTHEIGHWFNLQHIWGNGQCGLTCGDDGVSDTPITKGWQTCSVGPQAVCNLSIIENYQNYMDYSGCNNMFSAGQVSRMTAAINSTIAGRSNLWSNSNLIATGIINPISPCSIVPDFHSATNTYTICQGQGITFIDASFNGTVSSWLWSTTGGGIISNSTSMITGIVFPVQGIQIVTLQVNNSVGSASTTRTVLVLNSLANITNDYYESFENSGLPPNFKIINPDNDVTWAQCSFAGASGTRSYYIEGASDAPNSNPDIMETPAYDFLNNAKSSFTFKYAYAQKDLPNADKFKVQASSDCGSTWIDIKAFSNSAMALNSGGVSNSPFIPSSQQFVTYTLTDHPLFIPFLNKPNVRIRFSFTEDASSGYGNNIFLDDINFNSNSSSGINEFFKELEFSLFPNPTNNTTEMQYSLSNYSNVSYYVTDVCGNIIIQEETVNEAPGAHNVMLNEDRKLKAGFYFVNFSVGGQLFCRKFVIE